MDRIRAGFTTGTVAAHDNSVTASLTTQNTNGSWSDINYADQSATNWQPGTHWSRISTFARAYSREGSSYNGSQVLRQAIINGINYWLSLSPAPNSTNWFMLSISLPQDIGNSLVAMRYGAEPLSSSLENALIAWMVKGVPITNSPAKDGSNLTDVAQHYIARACLTQDQALLEQTVQAVSNSLVIVNNSSSGNINEGLQKDNSFTAHGPQLYLYGYGSVLVSGVSNIAGLVTGTANAFSADKIAIFSNFVRGSFLKATRGMYHDFNAFNRQISRPNDGRPNQFIVRNARNADLPEYADEYNAAISRINGSQPPSYQVAPEHLHFWRTDYTVHHRPSYMFGLRSVSTRTVKSENGNGENLKGYYMTEGANYIAVNGDEYYNIYPVWEWNKIPGTTVPEITTYPLRTAWGVNFGTSAFVGGVSDGQYGASTFAMNDYNTTAKKSWFFFDDEVVCLGAGIGSTAAQAINTTVNQCLLDGEVNVKTNAGTQTLANGSRQYAGDLQWAHHDNVGYVFPQGGNISLSNQEQSGTQKSINNSYSTTLITKDVFKLWFRHGVAPSGGSYAYIVTPGKTLAEMDTYNAAQIDVWANDATLQAVHHSGLNMLQVVFHQAGSITKNGITVSANSPCVLMLKNISGANVSVAVADPNQVNPSVVIGFQNEALGSLRIFTATMPGGLMAGSTFSGTIDANTPLAAIPDLYEAVGDAFVRDGSYAGI
ncbi:MAG TPA: polysaccharide lyase 8 family protein, partial [Phnomibacter sp.]|nr:polysaccharide lyase 8 family protein [Phnomibacter sp.]